MRRLFDVVCQNEDCSEYDEVFEVFMKYESPPECQACHEKLVIAIRKTPSVHFLGGKNAGFTNDGFINHGTDKKSLRRVNPK